MQRKKNIFGRMKWIITEEQMKGFILNLLNYTKYMIVTEKQFRTYAMGLE